MKREIQILVSVYFSNVCYLVFPYFSSSFKTICT